jgi:hypothetical protein
MKTTQIGIILIFWSAIVLLAFAVAWSTHNNKEKFDTTCLSFGNLDVTAPDGSDCKMLEDGSMPLGISTGFIRTYRVVGLSCTLNKNLSTGQIAPIETPVIVTTNHLVVLSDGDFNRLVCTHSDGTPIINGTVYDEPYIYIKYVDLSTNETSVDAVPYVFLYSR